jgi:hypothetical protein
MRPWPILYAAIVKISLVLASLIPIVEMSLVNLVFLLKKPSNFFNCFAAPIEASSISKR